MTDGNINLENSNLGEIKIENTYEYTGEYQEFTATFSGYYNVQLWGAQGGTHNTTLGGNGAYTAGDIYLNAGDTIYIYVGEQPTTSSGGWNGGGNGYDGSYHGLGGGGTAYYNGTYYGTGGSAGGLTGYISEKRGSNGRPDDYQGTGAEQSSGGFHYSNITLYNGGFGYGGASGTNVEGQGGGGSGYYGGGGGYDIGAGGGGSSYISGHLGCSSIDTILSTSYNSIVHTGSAYHDSGYYFKNTLLIDGKGYFWTSEIGSQIMMPTYDGTSTMTGNSGNG